VDAGVLIAAYVGDVKDTIPARAVLDDPSRAFVASSFLSLEVLPKARFHRRDREAEFYRSFFALATVWVEPTKSLLQSAAFQAETYGLAAMDALHVAAALAGNASELITTEKLSKPIHRVKELVIRSLHAA
jgi:predicted nucleic acid-binding protein